MINDKLKDVARGKKLEICSAIVKIYMNVLFYYVDSMSGSLSHLIIIIRDD